MNNIDAKVLHYGDVRRFNNLQELAVKLNCDVHTIQEAYTRLWALPEWKFFFYAAGIVLSRHSWIVSLNLRVLWQIIPSLGTCLLFWSSFLVLPFVLPNLSLSEKEPKLTTFSAIGTVLFLTGFLSNATVTIANGGFMPVVGGVTFSLWVTSTDKHNLLFLADRFAGFSAGDFLILSSIVLSLGAALYKKIRPT